MTDYLIRTAQHQNWHHCRPCVNMNDLRQPTLHWAEIGSGVIICSALDDHEVIEYRDDDNKCPLLFHSISAREVFGVEEQ